MKTRGMIRQSLFRRKDFSTALGELKKVLPTEIGHTSELLMLHIDLELLYFLSERPLRCAA